jgi:hypothetical protein
VDRISKLAIVAFALALLLAESLLVARTWPLARLLFPIFFASAVVAATFERRSVAAILAVSYLVPVLVFAQQGRYHATYSVVWLCALVGAVLPDAVRRPWHLPARWYVPLVGWAAGVCLTTPIIAMRAVDFHWDLFVRGRFPTEALGGFPEVTVAWILHVSLLLVTGLLWFDWLCGQDLAFVRRWVALPLGVSAAALAVVACYQLFVDVTFLNATVYAFLKRASGTLLDSNAAGALAAFWIGGWAMFASYVRGRERVGRLALAASMWVPVWATGSRTALAIASIVTLFSLAAFNAVRLTTRRGVITLTSAAVVLVGALALVSLVSTDAAGPIGRVAAMLPSRDLTGVQAALRELRDRNGYGIAATRVIAAYPAFGIGVGSFNEMASEFMPGGIPPDNAQNWYRHQVAELGVVGSVGWIVFLALFGAWILSRRGERAVASRPLLGVLIAAAVVSLLGMPGQDPFVAITLWTCAAWFVHEAGPPTGVATTAPRLAWAAAVAVVIVFVAGTAAQASGRLRLPTRIQRLGGEYTYGLYWPEPDGEGGVYRWARREATAVVPAPTRSLELTLRTNSIDLPDHPRRVQAWVNGRRVIDAVLKVGADSVTQSVMLPAGAERVLIETSTDRAVVAPSPDNRELALMVRWRFLPTSR